MTADLVTEMSGSASVLNNLLTSGNDLSQFTADTFSLLETVNVIDSTFSLEDLNSAIDQAKESTGDTNAVFSLVPGATINTADESAFIDLLSHEENGQVIICLLYTSPSPRDNR